MRIAYLIPEYPGQTHNFFRREYGVLSQLGVGVDVFSTRKPPERNRAPGWGAMAESRATYLYPIERVRYIFAAVLFLLLRPRKLLGVLSSIHRAGDVNGLKKIRLGVLALLGVHFGSILTQRGIAHVHVHSCADSANLALFAHIAHGISYSMTLHNPISVYGNNQLEKWRNSAFAIVIADWIYKDLTVRHGIQPPANTFIAGMGVDLARFKRGVLYRPFLGDGLLRLFCCARLNPAKGFFFLFDAMRLLQARGYQIELVIAGEDDSGGMGYRRVLEAEICKDNLVSCVKLLGATSEEVVIENLELAHIFVLASLEEPLGVAIMEAMSMGTPVVATDSGGVPSLISSGVDGILAQPESSQSLAVCIDAIASDPELASRIALNARNRAEISFGYESSAMAILRGLRESNVHI